MTPVNTVKEEFVTHDPGQNNPAKNPPTTRRREEPKIFTIWVHVGYTVLILSTITWILYLEYFLD